MTYFLTDAQLTEWQTAIETGEKCDTPMMVLHLIKEVRHYRNLVNGYKRLDDMQTDSAIDSLNTINRLRTELQRTTATPQKEAAS